jgi:hypothetical protein
MRGVEPFIAGRHLILWITNGIKRQFGKSARCQALAKEFTSEPAATRLRELEAEFQMQLLDAEQ